MRSNVVDRSLHEALYSRNVEQVNFIRRLTMWTKPEVTEMRFGFEVTMYVCNR